MNWVTLGLIIFLLVVVTLIIVTIYNLLPLGDERRKRIQLEAAAYSFAVVIMYLIIEIGVMTYTNLATSETFDNLNPFITLIIFSVVYLLSLVRAKGKYS